MQKKRPPKSPPKSIAAPQPLERHFSEVATIIAEGRSKAYQAVNSVLIETYWRVGRYISQKLAASEWGDKVVSLLADFLLKTLPDPRGFSDKNLWRMKQFHDLYGEDEIFSPLVRQTNP